MAAHKHRANTEACRMIEATLYEIVPSLDKPMANRLACQLASLREFHSLDSSIGSERLKWRIKKVSQKLLDHAERRRRASSSKSTSDEVSSTGRKRPLETLSQQADAQNVDCHPVLRKTVGGPKYTEIVSVSREINEIRQQSAVWTKFSQQRSFEEEERAPASETLPPPIANLYFRTRLIDAMRIVDAKTWRSVDEDVQQPRAGIVQRMDWDALLCDAKANLAAFQNFVKENVKEDETLSFQCKNGICLPSAHQKRRVHHEP